MYYYLTREIKRRFISELRDLIQYYPGLEKFKVTDKFPYQERPQYGVVIRNVSGDPIPLSADNFIGTRISHCFSAKIKGKKGVFLDWVREDPANITHFVTEDVSGQVDGVTNHFTVTGPIVQGQGNLDPIVSPRQIIARVNGRSVEVESASAQSVTLSQTPPSSATVTLQYWKRNLVPAGVYYLELTSPTEVSVDCLLDGDAVLISEAVGNETTTQLAHFPVFPKTYDVIEGDSFVLREGVHYNLNISTGEITWLENPDAPGQTLRPGCSYSIQYRYQGPSSGPFPVAKLQSGLGILPGVTLAISNWLEVGDRVVVIVTNQRELVAREFGGDFDLSFSFEIYSRDPIQREYISDLVAIHIWGVIKPIFDGQGILIKNVNLNGESEDEYVDTDTMYYKAAIDVNVAADWRLEAPLVPKIKFVVADIEAVDSINAVKISFVRKTEGII